MTYQIVPYIPGVGKRTCVTRRQFVSPKSKRQQQILSYMKHDRLPSSNTFSTLTRGLQGIKFITNDGSKVFVPMQQSPKFLRQLTCAKRVFNYRNSALKTMKRLAKYRHAPMPHYA